MMSLICIRDRAISFTKSLSKLKSRPRDQRAKDKILHMGCYMAIADVDAGQNIDSMR